MAEDNIEVQIHKDDPAFLHVLKEIPAWFVIFISWIIVTAVYLPTQDEFIKRMMDGAFGALLTALVANRQKQPTITAGKIETGDISSQTGAGNDSKTTPDLQADVQKPEDL